MANTSIRKVPYPLPGDPIQGFPAVAKALADMMDAEVLYVGKTAADPPSAYPMGLSLLTLNSSAASTGGWPDAVAASVLTAARYDSAGISTGFQVWAKAGQVADMRVRSASSNTWGAWVRLGYDPGWTNFTSSITGTSRYRQVGNVVFVHVDGTVDVPSGTTVTVSTSPLPVAVRPSVVVRVGCSCTGYAAVMSVTAAGDVQVIQQSGAARTSMSGILSYPLG